MQEKNHYFFNPYIFKSKKSRLNFNLSSLRRHILVHSREGVDKPSRISCDIKFIAKSARYCQLIKFQINIEMLVITYT